MPIRVELLLPKIEDVESRILSPYPQHAALIPIDRKNGVAVKAVGVALLVLKPVRETFGCAVKVVKTLAGWHP